MGGQSKSLNPKDLFNGAVLQCLEAITLGMPFEVWKTRMGRFRDENTIQAFVNVYKRAGILGFWQGIGPKMIESASKGAVLLFAKESILTAMQNAGCSNTLSGFVAGAGAGICQTSVMGPCTFLVTAAVTSSQSGLKVSQVMSETWATKGMKGF